jgi:hypothetical protein
MPSSTMARVWTPPLNEAAARNTPGWRAAYFIAPMPPIDRPATARSGPAR